MPQIDLIMNARQFNSEAKKAGDSVDQISGSLDDVARDGDKAADKLERSFRDIASEAKNTGKQVADIGDTGERGFHRVKDGAQEVTQELGQNLGEAVSSVRGDLSDLGQVGQDTLGGLTGSLAGAGPAGIAGAAVLAAGAYGLGAVTAELQKQQAEADALRERLSSAYQEAAEEGRNYLSTAQIVADANDLIFNPDRAEEYKRLREDAKQLNLDEATVIRANAGDLDAQAVVQEQINGLLRDQDSYQKLARGAVEALKPEVDDLRDRWAGVTDATNANREAAQNSLTVTSDLLRKAINDATEATKEVDEFGNELYTLPDGEQILIDAQTGKATQDLDKFKGDLDGVAEKVIEPVIRPRVDDSEWRKWQPGTKQARVTAVGPRQMTWE